MEEKTQLVPTKKLLELLEQLGPEEKMDKETISVISQFTEKYINDILSRAALLAKHRNSKVVTTGDVKFVLEKEFDYFIPESK